MKKEKTQHIVGIHYIRIVISIHGLNIENKTTLEFLRGLFRKTIYMILKGKYKKLFKFRDEFESDIEVDIEESAGDL